jgi:tRNA-specific 2-thiouridylase
MKTVYVGLSGGVDSSVTAALLQEQGYRVVGVYMKNWTQSIGGVDCPWKQDLADARASAAILDIPFKIFDFEALYKQKVVDYMVAEYQAGRTPNPDVMCNQEIKFKLFLDTALADGADMIATGHYARVVDGRLMTAADSAKDQTYFLYRVTGGALSKSLMPIGGYEKPAVRQLATTFNLPTANKPDSQGICFVGEVGMKAFLEQYVETVPGDVIHKGKAIGQHDGAIFYTIGQRHGLGIGGGKPYFVIGKDMAKNEVYVTDDPNDLNLETDEFTIGQIHWINKSAEEGKMYGIRARYRAALIDGRLEKVQDGYRVKLAKPERAISPGQSAVIYDGETVLGGGIITG